jgi:glucosamine--fructose-6-phosphate aminotransferase (isomerizing)
VARGLAAAGGGGGAAAHVSVAPGTTVVAVATGVLPRLLDDLAGLRARGARVIAIASVRDTEVLEHADEVVWLPTADLTAGAVAAAVPLQLLAHSMVANGGQQPSSTRGSAA